LGTWNPDINLSNTNGTAAWDTTGKKSYELTNHLGNVMATISDKRLQHSTDGSLIDYYDADVQTAQEYYSFGSVIPGRTYLSPVGGVGGGYRYGFNGKENDNEVKKDGYGNPNIGTQQDYGMRIYDGRLGRFLSVDPLTAKYPWYTPYSFAGNMPIRFIDMDGLEQGPPKFFFDPMPYTGSKSDYLKVLPNAATGVVNGGISLLYMAGDAFSTSVTAFQTGQSPFSYKDVNHSIHQLKTQVSERLTDLKNTKVADFNKYITSPQGLQETAEIGASMYLMSRPVLRTSAPIISEAESIAAGNGGAARAAQYSSEWENASLSTAVESFASGVKGVETSSGKTLFTNSKTGIQVVYDKSGNYFRIENTNLSGARRYLDLKGNIPNNKVVDGKIKGRSQAEYNQVTHYNNKD